MLDIRKCNAVLKTATGKFSSEELIYGFSSDLVDNFIFNIISTALFSLCNVMLELGAKLKVLETEVLYPQSELSAWGTNASICQFL